MMQRNFVSAAFAVLLLNCQTTALSIPLDGTFFGIANTNATFDYVIIGGGTSGLTVAKRLTETPNITVAVIEAGSFYELDNGNFSQIPGWAARGIGPRVLDYEMVSQVDWGFMTTPQAALGNRSVFYAQGKTLGGSSARNVYAYQRGVAGAFQLWSDRVGDSSFTFENLLPYFEKSIAFTPPNLTFFPNTENISDPSVFSPDGGPVQVSYSNYLQPFTPHLVPAFQQAGLSQLTSFYDGKMLGYAYGADTINPADSTRSSAETSFLRAALASNAAIQVYTRTSAKKILFDSDKTATGVLVQTSGGMPYELSARKEVICAAGVFKTPQMLMVSGIGPQKVLDSLNIPVLSALEGVGQNMWDHPYYGVGYRSSVTSAQQLSTNATYLAQATSEFLNSQSGPLTNVGGDLLGFSKVPSQYRSNFTKTDESNLAMFPPDWPEIEYLPLNVATFPVNDTADYFSITVANAATTSRGTVSINSTNTDDQPLINPNWLASETDQRVAVAAFKAARALGTAAGIAVGPEFFPGPSVQTDAQILDFLRETTYTIHHAAGTAKMGKPDDPMAVVSTNGTVYGVKNLRVVDASTFPVLPPGHIQGIVYMLAERYADLIRKGY